MIGDVILGLSVILVLRIGMLFLDGCDLGVTDGLDLVTVGEVRMVSGGHVVVVLIGLGGLHVLMCSDLKVMRSLAVVVGGLQVELVLFLGNHWSSPE